MGHCKEFPLLYFNLGGEMMYIIQQRLEAQHIDKEKSTKVLNDILSTLLNRKFLRSLFAFESGAPPVSSLKSLYEKIVHVSIMKLAPESMEKLFDLMVMGVKHQMFQIPSADLMIAVTLNHIDSWKLMTTDPDVLLQINHVHSAFCEAYSEENAWTLQQIRWSLLNYVLGWKIRVSIFLKKQIQNDNGHFCPDLYQSLPSTFEQPGCIRNLQDSSKSSKFLFPISPDGCSAVNYAGSKWFTQLGTNVYANEEQSGAKVRSDEKKLLNSLLLGEAETARKGTKLFELRKEQREDPGVVNLDEERSISFALETEIVRKAAEELELPGIASEVDDNLLDLMDEAVNLC